MSHGATCKSSKELLVVGMVDNVFFETATSSSGSSLCILDGASCDARDSIGSSRSCEMRLRFGARWGSSSCVARDAVEPSLAVIEGLRETLTFGAIALDYSMINGRLRFVVAIDRFERSFGEG